MVRFLQEQVSGQTGIDQSWFVGFVKRLWAAGKLKKIVHDLPQRMKTAQNSKRKSLWQQTIFLLAEEKVMDCDR